MGASTSAALNIVGAGLAGVSAAIRLAMAGIPSRLISSQPSERAQSVLAEGGINGVLDTMGEHDSVRYHFADTMHAGCDIADPAAVRDLTEHAPEVLRWLAGLGMPFQRSGQVIQQRYFGGQKKARTAYAQSSTGRALMSTLADEARRYEASGLIERYSRHDLVRLLLGEDGATCRGVVVRDNATGELRAFSGPVLVATGGLCGLFPGRTTGTTTNTGDAAATLFSQGVAFSNLEMIQYHPTTLAIPCKRLLVSEAARGEGGRLFVLRRGQPWYFMEERYPELGNLMPRDVVSREEYFVAHDPSSGGQVFLDCTGLSRETWRRRLPDLRREVIYYTGKDPARVPIAVEPGIHYFMGGIDVDAAHRTSVLGLYAAGECCSLYHGANRLGGNSTLGAVFGGARAAQTIAEELDALPRGEQGRPVTSPEPAPPRDRGRDRLLGEILYASLGVVRDAHGMEEGVARLHELLDKPQSKLERARTALGLAMLESALLREESRGAHYRSDFPERDDRFRATTVAVCDDVASADPVRVSMRAAQQGSGQVEGGVSA